MALLFLPMMSNNLILLLAATTTTASLPTTASARASSSSVFLAACSTSVSRSRRLLSSSSSPFVVVHRDYDGNNVNVMMAANARPPGKGDLYDDDELLELLTIHQALSTTIDDDESSGNGHDESNLGGDGDVSNLHDWVLQTLKNDRQVNDSSEKANEVIAADLANEHIENSVIDVDENNNNGIERMLSATHNNLHKFVSESIGEISSSSLASSPSSSNHNELLGRAATPSGDQNNSFETLQTLLRERKPNICAIATDIDGTLLSGKYMHPITRDAVLRGIQQATSTTTTATNKIRHFFPATGKSRRGAALSLGPVVGPRLVRNRSPGVYLQGSYCVAGDGGVVVFEKRLSGAAVRAAEGLASALGVSVVGYDGDELYAAATSERLADEVRELSEVYGEPPVEVLVDDENPSTIVRLAERDRGWHKLLLIDGDAEKLASVRVSLEELAAKNDATVTQAVPTMLELLPAGCSKADGVRRVCEALGIDPSTELLALGDAENDVGMLRMASIGVAVANACPLARDAADFIMRERHDEGGAGLAMTMFAFEE